MSAEYSGQEEYAFLSAVVNLLQPRKILEIGTSSGQGTLALARNLPPNGKIVTVDMEDIRSSELKMRCTENSGIVFIRGQSSLILKNLAKHNEGFDLIFIDGEHHFKAVNLDWHYSKKLSETIILHDALQFNGVRRVIDRIRKDPSWDVSVLSYPGTTLYDSITGRHFFSNRVPGIAIATRRKPMPEGEHTRLYEYPTHSSKHELKIRTAKYIEWYHHENRSRDINFHDWQMIFHTIWNFHPELIVHAGHVGTDATLIFLDYAQERGIPFVGIDPTGTFWSNKRLKIPRMLFDRIIHSEIITGRQDLSEFKKKIRRSKAFLWVDEYKDATFYNQGIRILLECLSKNSIACIRNFSPHRGAPKRVVIGESECTNPRAFAICDWLKQKPFRTRLASPEATFGDYVNAGHWLIIQPRSLSPKNGSGDPK